MTYDRNMVLATYRAEHPDNLEPKPSTLTGFEENLVEIYDAEMRTQAAQNQIPVNRFNLSMLVFFASQSRAEGIATRVRHACRYFRSVRPQP